MKTVFILIGVFLISCSSKNIKQETLADHLSTEEKNIVNDFLEFEFKKKLYNRYKNFNYVIIEEASKQYRSIFSYEFSYNSYYKMKKDKSYWLWDSTQIQKIKTDLKSEKQYYWKTTDFRTLKIGLLKDETLQQITKKDAYLFLPKRLIIWLSRPLMVDENNYLLSFDVGNSQLGVSMISHFTIMMRKKDGKWIKEAYFEDGSHD